MVGILCEKPSQARNFAKALGGASGIYKGEQYLIVAARGHLYEFVDPHLQVKKDLQNRYYSWSLDNLPWNEQDFMWKYSEKKDEKGSAKDTVDLLKSIKNSLSTCDEIVIGTDFDPSGEGMLLGVEILQNLQLRPKKWSRMHFIDESEKEIQKAFTNRFNVPVLEQNEEYVMAYLRSRWDFLSQQFVRIATKCGDGKSILREGRLKSAMQVFVGDQLKAVAAYKKIPYYQNRFRDENNIVYTNPDEPNYKTKEEVPNIYHDSAVVVDSKTMKKTAPPKLLDLASLASRLAPKGYKAKLVADVYQKMYEAQIVSYPRTEDKCITPEQFDELLPLVDKIATVVGVDASLLTHRTQRPTHVKKGGAHGANRPGTNVPKSLDALASYDGKSGAGCAAAIYEMLAKNYLAMLAEDYEYENQKGHLKDYPKFVGVANVPKFLGWKAVYTDDSLDDDEDDSDKGLGTLAKPFIHEGFPPKPATPTMKWLMTQLEKADVGTGATRTSTYADITNEKTKYPLFKDTKGKISMTNLGDMSYILLQGTNIGSIEVTKQLLQDMKGVANGSKNPDLILADVRRMVIEDMTTMKENRTKLKEELGIVAENAVEKYTGTWNGKEAKFNKSWSGHAFTDEECEKLCNGEELTIDAVSSKDGTPFKCKGVLAEQEFVGSDKKKHKYIGFKVTEYVNDGTQKGNGKEKYEGTWNGRAVSFAREWSGHRFTDEECEKLCNGEELQIDDAKSAKTGSTYKCKGVLAEQEFKDKSGNSRKFIGFMRTGFVNDGTGKGSGSSTGGIPDAWCGHTFTSDEKEVLMSGLPIEAEFKWKSGNKSTCQVRFGKKKDGTTGLIPAFSPEFNEGN